MQSDDGGTLASPGDSLQCEECQGSHADGANRQGGCDVPDATSEEHCRTSSTQDSDVEAVPRALLWDARSSGSRPDPAPLSCFLIDVPPKQWLPKTKSRFEPKEELFDDDLFIHKKYGCCMYKERCVGIEDQTNPIWQWDDNVDKPELEANLQVGSDCTPELRVKLERIIKDHWDSFFEEGAWHPVLGYEFVIDTGTSKPVSVRPPDYGSRESVLMLDQIKVLKHNDWIREFLHGGWGDGIILAPKPHQEHVTDIKDFVWRMCVSYRKLNSVTEPFVFPIPRCSNAVKDLGGLPGPIYFISVDAQLGYHQIRVAEQSVPKLAFFAPDGKKYSWNVCPFGPTNLPAFYTAMMVNFQTEWDALAKEHNLDSALLGSCIIIDDIILFSSDPMLLLKYFDCVCTIFTRHRMSFELSKCELFSIASSSLGSMSEKMETCLHDPSSR